MTVGVDTHLGVAPVLKGESEIIQNTAATDILTVTGATSQSGDFLVLRNVSETELAYFDSNGDLNMYKTGQAAFGRIKLAILATAPASAGLVKGDIWLAAAGTANIYRLAMCSSTASGKVQYGHRIDLDTIGSTT